MNKLSTKNFFTIAGALLDDACITEEGYELFSGDWYNNDNGTYLTFIIEETPFDWSVCLYGEVRGFFEKMKASITTEAQLKAFVEDAVAFKNRYFG